VEEVAPCLAFFFSFLFFLLFSLRFPFCSPGWVDFIKGWYMGLGLGWREYLSIMAAASEGLGLVGDLDLEFWHGIRGRFFALFFDFDLLCSDTRIFFDGATFAS